MYKNHNYIPTFFEVNALSKCNDFSCSLGTCMIFFFLYNNTCSVTLDLLKGVFTPFSTVFQSYLGDSSHYSCLSWVSQVLGWALKCLAQGHSHEKTQRIQCGSNPGPLDYDSNTLPLSYAGPLLCYKVMCGGMRPFVTVLVLTTFFVCKCFQFGQVKNFVVW